MIKCKFIRNSAPLILMFIEVPTDESLFINSVKDAVSNKNLNLS